MIKSLFLLILFLYAGNGFTDQPLPPDPGVAGKQSLLGIDVDYDGVRDDIQRYIYFKYPNGEKERLAMTQIAIQYQELLVHANDTDAAFHNATQLARHGECLDYLMGEASGGSITALKAKILNTKERSIAYIEFNKSLAGKIIIGAPLKEWKNSCNFNPDN